MKGRKKKRIRKAILKRQKEIDKERTAVAWKNIFVRAGILK